MIDFTSVTYPPSAIIKALLIAVVAIVAASCIKEPERQKLMAVVMGLAGGVYLNGGFIFWEFPFSILILVCAYQGLRSYRAIGFGWLLHTAWDILHHAANQPMISILPTSSLECAITDIILAAWFFAGASNVRLWFSRRANKQVE